MRNRATLLPAAFHKHICGPFLRAELLSHEFPLGAGDCGNHCTVSINADPKIFGFHSLVRQRTRFDDFKETRTLNYFAVGINDDPVIRHEASETCEIILNDCLCEFFLPSKVPLPLRSSSFVTAVT